MYKPLFLMLFCCAFTAKGQRISQSEPYPVTGGLSTCFTEEQSCLVLRLSGDGVTAQKFNTAGPGLERTHFTANNKKEMPFAAKRIGSRYYVLYYALLSQGLRITAREVNFSTGEISTASTGMLDEPEKIEGGGTVKLVASRNENKFVVRYKIKNANNSNAKNHESYRLNYFDGSLVPAAQNTIVLPITENGLTLNSEMLDTKGSFYMEFTKLTDSYVNEGRVRLVKFTNHLFRVPYARPEIKEITPVPEQGRVVQFVVFEPVAGKVMCAGVTQASDYGVANGIKLYEIKEDGQIVFGTDLTAHMLKRYALYPGSSVTSLKLGFTASATSFVIDQVLPAPGGGFYLVGQERYMESELVTHGGSASSQSISSYGLCNDMLIFRVNDTGGQEWSAQVPGRITMTPHKKIKPTYAVMRSSNGLALLCLEGKGELALVKVSETGTFDKKDLLELKSWNGTPLHQVAAERFMSCGMEAFLFEAYIRKERNVLIKVDVNE